MVKVGKKEDAHNPFKGGKGGITYDALEDALEGLDHANVSQAPEVPNKKDDEPKTPAPSKKAKEKKQRKAKPSIDEMPPAPKLGEGVKRFAKRFQATRKEGAQFDAAAMRLSAAVGSKVDFSKLNRTLWQVYLQHEEDIIRNVTKDLDLGHPSTGDDVGRALLEHEVVQLINRGLMLASRRPSNLD